MSPPRTSARPRPSRGAAGSRIARELTARGVSRELVDEALDGIEAGAELATIRKILARKRWPANPSTADRQRMFRHLFARGFPADLIGKALGGRVDHDQDDEP